MHADDFAEHDDLVLRIGANAMPIVIAASLIGARMGSP
jgi:hypothetical protein